MSRRNRFTNPAPNAEVASVANSDQMEAEPAIIQAPAPAFAVVSVAPIRPPATRWRVLKDARYANNGCVTWVIAGQLVSLEGHGEDGVRKMREQGVELEEVY